MSTPVNGSAAADTMLGFGSWREGYCLEAVWNAYKQNGASSGQSYPTATDAWYGSAGKHPDDRNPPRGVPVYWGPRSGSYAGDVVISWGGGQVVATDVDGNGTIGIMTIDARERQIGRPYLGWTETILNYPIDYGQTPPAPQPPPEEDMAAFSIVHQADDNGIYAQSQITGDRTRIDSPYHVTLLERVRDSDINGHPMDTLNGAELDIVRGYLAQINVPAGDPVGRSATAGQLRAAIIVALIIAAAAIAMAGAGLGTLLTGP